MRQQHTTVSVNVWPWVRSFAVFSQHVRDDFIEITTTLRGDFTRQLSENNDEEYRDEDLT